MILYKIIGFILWTGCLVWYMFWLSGSYLNGYYDLDQEDDYKQKLKEL